MIVICIMGLTGQTFKVPALIFNFPFYWGLKKGISFTVTLLLAPAFFHTALANQEDEMLDISDFSSLETIGPH